MDFAHCWIISFALKLVLTRSGWFFFRDKSVSVVFEAAKEAAALCLYSA